MVCGWVINFLQSTKGWSYIPACQVVFFIYAAVGALKFLLTLGLSRKVEAVKKEEEPRTQQNATETESLLGRRDGGREAPEPRKKSLFSNIERDLLSLVIRLFILFGLDSFASGLASL